ncbi:SH3 and multiple ankyrin repeat domains protein 1 [Lonchura striata]|uniref:SH3 and multiple ankyrin repeat domains protein 1 n=1 Tax=Lonchura striata TaxID=40157 RepID=A0A218UUR9_9PASE|nr:SH3 and multiple ankyrin repeat domains protein 1 [Lonchura striata domestica]
MPRSPTSSEDEMAQSFSDYSVESESDSSKEETIYDTIRATAEKPSSRMEDNQSNTLVIRIIIPDLQQTKCIRFNPEASVWVAKQRILCTLNQSLKDVLNYGLFQPASNGRDGKFLDEERLLREYPQPVNKGVPSLEFRYKKRVYRQFNLDEKQLAKLHTKANLKKFMDHVHHLSVEKMTKMLDRGLDPNYHDLESGETPLTLAAQLDNTVEVIKTLKNGGAHLDFRAKDGMTALHKAARAKNQVALKVNAFRTKLFCDCFQTLLELGASPNYKDSCGLTPLYHTVIVGGDPFCCELLLHEHATVSCKDENGWQEIHQVGKIQARCVSLYFSLNSGVMRLWCNNQNIAASLPRLAGMDTSNTWSTSCSTAPTCAHRTPRGTRPCTSVPSTTRRGKGVGNVEKVLVYLSGMSRGDPDASTAMMQP